MLVNTLLPGDVIKVRVSYASVQQMKHLRFRFLCVANYGLYLNYNQIFSAHRLVSPQDQTMQIACTMLLQLLFCRRLHFGQASGEFKELINYQSLLKLERVLVKFLLIVVASCVIVN